MQWHHTLCLIAIISGLQNCTFAQRTPLLDFNEDPAVAGIGFFGEATWNNSSEDGYLSIAEQGEQGAVVFPFLTDPPGSALDGYRLSLDVRVGGADTLGRGMSINILRLEDPLLTEPLGNHWVFAWDEPFGIEEGSQTGLSVGIDVRHEGPIAPDTGKAQCDSVEHDCVGISLRVDGELITQASFPVVGGKVDDPHSLQTFGPDGDLAWAKLDVLVRPCSHTTDSWVTITYKDRLIVDRFISLQSAPGLLLLAADGQESTARFHVDNVALYDQLDIICPFGDFNLDGTTDAADFNILAGNMNTEPVQDPFDVYRQGDITFDGRIDLHDFAMFRDAYNRWEQVNTMPVPESAGESTMMLGFLILHAWIRHRSRRGQKRRWNASNQTTR